MKTASELALEYWDKPPIERVNTTLQDYVYDYMFEKLSEKQNKIDGYNVKLKIFIDDAIKTHNDDKDNKIDYWRGFADSADSFVKVFYRDVGFLG